MYIRYVDILAQADSYFIVLLVGKPGNACVLFLSLSWEKGAHSGVGGADAARQAQEHQVQDVDLVLQGRAADQFGVQLQPGGRGDIT